MQRTFQIAYRSNQDFAIADVPQDSPQPTPLNSEGQNAKLFLYSPNGFYLAYIFNQVVHIMNPFTKDIIFTKALSNVVEMSFSPNDSYFSTYERYVKPKEGEEQVKNLKVWDVKSGDLLVSFTQKNITNWAVQWTKDEAYCTRLVNDELQIFETKSLLEGKLNISSKLSMEGLSAFSISPGNSPAVAVFVRELKGRPAIVRMFSLANLVNPLSSKTFYKADRVKMLWNSLGTNLLVLTQTEVDQTGKSYYGETNLYYLSLTGNFDCRVTLSKEGPIHDVTWNPNAKEFIVIYGYMPAKITLFDNRVNPIYEFGTHPRNEVKYSPNGRIICMAGFGNLASDMDFWDAKTYQKLATCKASGSSMFEWSSDSRYVLTAILSPRLRVDNGIKIWHYTGPLVWAQEFKELYQVAWQPVSPAQFPVRRELSPPPPSFKNAPAVVAEKKPAGKYRPPHARNAGSANGTSSSPPLPVGMSSPQNPSFGKSKGSKSAKQSRTKQEDSGAPDKKPVSPNSSGSVLTQDAVLEKQIRNLKKKVDQIVILENRLNNGETLEANQLQKISRLSELTKELNGLILARRG